MSRYSLRYFFSFCSTWDASVGPCSDPPCSARHVPISEVKKETATHHNRHLEPPNVVASDPVRVSWPLPCGSSRSLFSRRPLFFFLFPDELLGTRELREAKHYFIFLAYAIPRALYAESGRYSAFLLRRRAQRIGRLQWLAACSSGERTSWGRSAYGIV